MLSLPKLPYVAVGLLEALAAASGMAAGGNTMFMLNHITRMSNRCFKVFPLLKLDVSLSTMIFIKTLFLHVLLLLIRWELPSLFPI